MGVCGVCGVEVYNGAIWRTPKSEYRSQSRLAPRRYHRFELRSEMLSAKIETAAECLRAIIRDMSSGPEWRDVRGDPKHNLDIPWRPRCNINTTPYVRSHTLDRERELEPDPPVCVLRGVVNTLTGLELTSPRAAAASTGIVIISRTISAIPFTMNIWLETEEKPR